MSGAAVDEYLKAVQLFCFCFGNAVHCPDVSLCIVLKRYSLSVYPAERSDRAKAVCLVPYQRCLIYKIFYCLPYLFIARRRRHFSRSRTEELSVFTILIYLQSGMLDVLRPVLIQPVFNKIKFPAMRFDIRDLPRVCFGMIQHIDDPVHYPSLPLVLRYGPPSVTLTHSLCPLPQYPLPNTLRSPLAIEMLPSRSGT